MAMASGILSLVFLFVFLGVMILGEILFAVGIHNDAKGNYNPNPMMWALLTVFLGWIPAIVYFCVRKNNFIKVGCPNCRNMLPEPQPVCPFCRTSIAVPLEDPAFIALRAKGKKQMIAGAILYGISYVLFIVFYILFFVFAFRMSGAWN